MLSISELEQKSRLYRIMILTMIKEANAGHTGGSLSCVDILNVLYNGIMNITPENFRQHLSCSHMINKGSHENDISD